VDAEIGCPSPDVTTVAGGNVVGQLRLGAKSPLLVRAGSEAEIVVAPEWRDRVVFWWGNTGGGTRPASTFLVGPCRPPGSVAGGWLVYPGGFFVSDVACVSLLVRAAGVERRVQIGIGDPCPGQLPPPQRSDR
jgi:hypothetical protein